MPRSKANAKKSEKEHVKKSKQLSSQKIARKSAPVTTGVKRPHRWRPGTVAMRQIKKYQKSTDLLIQKARFQRIVRGLVHAFYAQGEKSQHPGQGRQVHRFQANALLALQEATEGAIVDLIQDAHLCSHHAKRITLMKSDVILARRIRGDHF